MFEAIRPQCAMDSDGTIVQVGGRYCVQCIHGNFISEMEIDFADVSSLFVKRLTSTNKCGDVINIPAQDTEFVINKIKEGLKCLGIAFIVYNDSP